MLLLRFAPLDVYKRQLQEDACALYGTDADGNPAAYLATYGSRSMDDIAYVDPLSTCLLYTSV